MDADESESGPRPSGGGAFPRVPLRAALVRALGAAARGTALLIFVAGSATAARGQAPAPEASDRRPAAVSPADRRTSPAPDRAESAGLPLRARLRDLRRRHKQAPVLAPEASAGAALAARQLAQGEPRAALETARAALKTSAEKPADTQAEAHLVLGRVYAALEEWGLATRAFRRALELAPGQDRRGEALDALAQLEARELPSPASFREVVGRYLRQDPLTLDEDASRYLLGFAGGLRLQRIDAALDALEAVWTGAPKSPHSDRAILHAAILRGFALDQRDRARALITRLERDHPDSAHLGLAALARAFLHLAEGDREGALAAVSSISPGDGRAAEGALAGAILAGYVLGDGPRALGFLDALERLSGDFRMLGRYHRALLLFARLEDFPAARRVLDRVEVGAAAPEGWAVPKGWVDLLDSGLEQVLAARTGGEARLRFARFFERIGHYPRARYEYARVGEDFPGTPSHTKARLRLAALEQDDRGRFGAEIPALEAGLASGHLGPAAKAEARWRLARAQLKLGTPASEVFRQAERHGDAFADAALRGLVLNTQGSDPDRLEILDGVARELDPEDPARPRVLQRLGRSLEEAGEWDQALAVYQELLADHPAAAARADRIMDRRRVLALAPGGVDPEAPSKRVRLALFRLRLGEVREAETLLEGARKNAEEDPVASARATAYLARLLHRRKARPERIREVLDDALGRPELPGRDRLVLREIEARRLMADEPEQAERILRELVRAGYGGRRILPELVRRRRDADGPEAALGLLGHLVGDLEPDAALTALTAELYEATRQFRRARDARERLVAAWPESPEAKAAADRLAQREARALSDILDSRRPASKKLEGLEDFLTRVEPAQRGPYRMVVDDWIARAGAGLEPAVRLRLGEIYLEQFSDPRRALPLLEAARQVTGLRGARAQLALARTQRSLGDLRGAYRSYEDAASHGGREGAAARLAQARLHEEHFGEPAAAFAKAREALDAQPEPALAVELGGLLLRTYKAAAVPPRELLSGLERLRQSVRGEPLEAEILAVQAEAAEEIEGAEAASARWLVAARATQDPAKAVAAATRGLDLLRDAGRPKRVSAEATRFLRDRPGLPGSEPLRRRLRRSSARLQVDTLMRGLDWADPESPKNRDNLWRAAQLLVNPMEDFRQAAARLQELVQLFPGSTEGRRAEVLLRKLPVLEAAARVDPAAAPPKAPDGGAEAGADTAPDPPAKTRPEDRLAAARFVEYRLKDRDRAAAAYKAIYQEEEGVVSLYAGIAWLRLMAHDGPRREEAWRLVEALRARPIPASLRGRLRGRVAALAGADDWRALEARARVAGPDADAARAEMVRRAAASYQDGALAMAALTPIKDRGVKFDAALEAARALDPAASPAPESPKAAAFFDLAIQVAPDPERRAEALVARARHREASPAPARALPDYRQAARLAPTAPAGEEAMYRRAQLLLDLGRDEDVALETLNQLIQSHPDGERFQLASQNANELARRLQARQLDSKAARDGGRDPTVYFHTGKLLAERYQALPEALENFRTFIRVGGRPDLLIQAHREGADVLVRLQRPREAVLMLDRLLRQAYAGLDRPGVELARAKLLEIEVADLEAARRAYEKLLKSRPPQEVAAAAKEGLERIEGLSDPAGPGVERDPGAVPASLAAIRDEYLKGRRKNYRAAAEALTAALDRSRDPADQAALALELAVIEERHIKRPKRAAEAYERYLGVVPSGKGEAAALLAAGTLYFEKLGRPRRAHELFGRFLDTYHSHRQRVATMLKQGQVLEELDRVQEAIQLYQIISDSFPRSGHDELALERLAYLRRTYFAAFQDAVTAYRELIARFPFSRLADDAQYAIGRIFEIELGDLNQAKLEYEGLIQRYPSSEYVGRAQQGLTRIARR